ncbi:alkaline phosphatase family protein [Shewanella algae]|uniref:alkaline phosphatase family protein n=1 Tax=Shewanella algae TaxID=38313 RepID=UPI001FB880AE|nr:alkaline phosphatase family protein [Shewanella algae]
MFQGKEVMILESVSKEPKGRESVGGRVKGLFNRRSKAQALALSFGLALSLGSNGVRADINTVPLVAPLYHGGDLLQKQLFKGLELSVTTGRDLAIFSVAGMSLDAYILTLPLDAPTKARVIARLSDPFYSIPLGHFLYLFYDRYSRAENRDQFRDYLLSQYSKEQIAPWQHSLFSLEEQVKDNTEPTAEANDRREGMTLNRQLLAMLVTVYDRLFNNDDWALGKKLPEHYRYLGDSPEDLALIADIQPLIINEIGKYVGSLPEGDMRSALELIIEDGKAENAAKVNNKAQAITVTLIDFVRLNVLKAYRQYALPAQRAKAFSAWMQASLKEDPKGLSDFLASWSQRPRAVQITVDGLSQGLMQALVAPNSGPYLKEVLARDAALSQLSPASAMGRPQHTPKQDFLRQLVKDGGTDQYYLPFFKSLYRRSENGIATGGISSTPTISVRNLPIIKTGATVSGQGGTGIPNFHFVDRTRDRAYYFFGNDALQLENLAESRGMRTMFDRLNYLKTLNCNAQYDWNAQTSFDALVNLGLGEVIRDFGEQRCLNELSLRAEAEKGLQHRVAAVREQLEAYDKMGAWRLFSRMSLRAKLNEQLNELALLSEQAMPDYLLIYNPWPDHFAHFKGPFSDEIIAPTGELNRLDYWLGRLDKVYRDAGIYPQTLWGMAGDHGLAPVYHTLNPELVLQDALKQCGVELKISKISSDEGEGPKITNNLNPPSLHGVDLVIASTAGGNYMLDFFNSDRGWQVQPLYQELTRFKVKEGKALDMVSLLADELQESLDYLVVRQSDCTLDSCSVRLVGYRNGLRRDEMISRESGVIRYQALDAKGAPELLALAQSNPYLPPLSDVQLSAKQQLLELCLGSAKGCSAEQWRSLAAMSPRPDAVVQLAHLYDEDRAGTINLFPKEGVGYNTLVPGRHAGEHYLEKDAFIGFWGETVKPGQRLGPLDNGSLAPTLYQYLTGEQVEVGDNGWGYPSVLSSLN